MAESGVILPVDSTGKALRSETVTTTFTTGSGGLVHQQVVTLADSTGVLLGTTAAPVPVSISTSGGQTAVAAAITAAGSNTPGTASTGNTTGQVAANVSLAGNATFHIVTSAFVGTLIFEGSVDAGLNYAPLMAIREDGTGSESSIAISTAAAFIRQYTVALPGLNYFRVRASAFTSGSAAIIIAPGPTLFEPSPSLAASSATIGTVNTQPSTLVISTTAAISTALTATLPAAGAGLFHYITGIEIQRYAGAALTGAAAPTVVTTTNLPGSLAWSFDTAGAIGTSQIQLLSFAANPLKSSVANTATTIVAPLTTSVIWRINVSYYTA